MNQNKKNLSIRLKVIISFLLLASAFTVIFYIISNKVILKSYKEVENNVINVNIKRVDFAIKNLENTQNVKIKDWANWDDTYNFIKDLNTDYIEDNLQMEGLVNLDVNFMAFVNKEGKIILNKAIDIEKEKELSAVEITSSLSKYDKLLKHENVDSIVSGIIKTPYGIMSVSSSPVLHNDGSGPIEGTIIMGHLLDKNVAKGIGDALLYPVEIFNYNDSSADIIEVTNKLSSLGVDKFTKVLSDNQIAGYSIIYDIDDKPIAIMKITLARDSYNRGQNSFNYFTMIIGIMILSFVIEIIFLFEILIMRRFARLHKEFMEISRTKDLTKRITVDKNDEIGDLSYIINNIFNDLQTSQEKEKDLIKKEKEAVENLRKHAEETDKLNKLMIARELKMIDMKKEAEELKNKHDN